LNNLQILASTISPSDYSAVSERIGDPSFLYTAHDCSQSGNGLDFNFFITIINEIQTYHDNASRLDFQRSFLLAIKNLIDSPTVSLCLAGIVNSFSMIDFSALGVDRSSQSSYCMLPLEQITACVAGSLKGFDTSTIASHFQSIDWGNVNSIAAGTISTFSDYLNNVKTVLLNALMKSHL
jgi:hypothetical protein